MAEIANDRWFPLIDLLFAVASGTLWYMAAGGLGWQPLLIVLVPWGIRLSGGKPLFRRTRFDSLLLVFLLTAATGVWSAYDREAAWGKFWIIVSAIFIYYALAGQLRRDIWRLAGGLGSCSALVAGYFFLTHDWGAWPSDIGVLDQIGSYWMAIRSPLQFLRLAPTLHPNTIGGTIAMLFPFLVAFAVHVRRRGRQELFKFTAVTGCFSLLGLLFTSSRGAWIALAAALSVWLLWEWSRLAGKLVRLPRQTAFILMLISLCLALLIPFLYFDGAVALLGRLPGPDHATTRLELARRAWRLVGDYPFTGSGLGSFPALYSNYVMVTPVFFLGYSNFFLDVLLEQGAAGFLSLVTMLLGAVWLLVKRPQKRPVVAGLRESPTTPSSLAVAPAQNSPQKRRRRRRSGKMSLFRWATFSSLIGLALLGLTDDALYAGMGTPLLFFLPGLAVAISGERVAKHNAPAMHPFARQLVLAVTVVAFFVVPGLIYGFRGPLRASWYANLGAIEMARVELAGWPTNKWDDGSNVTALAPAADLFHHALSFAPDNRTARHRLGLIAMLGRDYGSAVTHLEAAYERDNGHRGIQKSLGYSYVWTGQFDKAAVVLADIQEAKTEMDIYSRWWAGQGRADLAANAAEMTTWLDNGTALSREIERLGD